MTNTEHTTATLDSFTTRDDFAGFGYTGERDRARTANEERPAIDTSLADTALLDAALARTWDTERLFAFCNSKVGRWYADDVFGRMMGRRGAPTAAEITAMAAAYTAKFDSEVTR